MEDPRYRHIVDDSRLFLADDADELSRFIERHVRHRSRHDVLFLLEKGRVVPAPALVERVARMLDGNPEFDLIDAQNEAFQVIRHAIAGVATAAERQVFIVHGGPGTGKSVIPAASNASARRPKKFKAHVHPPFILSAQFRCGGSDGYINWLDDVLQIRPTGNFDNWAEEQYDFRVFDDAADLYRELVSRNVDNKARLVAGYSWDWPTEGRQRRGHVKHVTVDGLSLPWNFSGENWATAADGIGQVGCVHTCQGVEFDWLGVLIGPDLRFQHGRIVGDPAKRARTDSSLSSGRGFWSVFVGGMPRLGRISGTRPYRRAALRGAGHWPVDGAAHSRWFPVPLSIRRGRQPQWTHSARATSCDQRPGARRILHREEVSIAQGAGRRRHR